MTASQMQILPILTARNNQPLMTSFSALVIILLNLAVRLKSIGRPENKAPSTVWPRAIGLAIHPQYNQKLSQAVMLLLKKLQWIKACR